MIDYNKSEIREQLNIEQVFELLQEWGRDPQYTPMGIVSATICHNPVGEGSHKLYFYKNTTLFKCWTGCGGDSFDIFELLIKVAKNQWDEDYDLNTAVRWIAKRFGFSGTVVDGSKTDDNEDWKLFAKYGRIQDIELKKSEKIILKEYDDKILNNFNYKVRITPWLKEGITPQALNKARIGFYPGGDQITIPHFDGDGRFIGLRGRTVCDEEATLYGKYRPIKVNNILYNHPLGMNLYNYNNVKENIKTIKKAVVVEGEKSCLKYRSYFGVENDISVACCGSNISHYQVQMLKDLGVEEIVIAFDKQFKELGDEECKQWQEKLIKINQKYKNDVLISFIWDKYSLLGYKDSPLDKDKETFLYLFKHRIII